MYLPVAGYGLKLTLIRQKVELCRYTGHGLRNDHLINRGEDRENSILTKTQKFLPKLELV